MSKIDQLSLLSGAWYALEQAGRLLDSASLLYDAGDHSTALGIAMRAREELGKYRILLDLDDQASVGNAISMEEVQNALGDHVSKQRMGLLSITMRVDRDSQLGRLLVEADSSPSVKAVADTRDQIVKQKAKRTPADRHNTRMEAFYVDFAASGQWSRPVAIDRQRARDEVVDAVNDYSVQFDRVQRRGPDVLDPKMVAVLEKMNPSPQLKSPHWPRYEAVPGAAPSGLP